MFGNKLFDGVIDDTTVDGERLYRSTRTTTAKTSTTRSSGSTPPLQSGRCRGGTGRRGPAPPAQRSRRAKVGGGIRCAPTSPEPMKAPAMSRRPERSPRDGEHFWVLSVLSGGSQSDAPYRVPASRVRNPIPASGGEEVGSLLPGQLRLALSVTKDEEEPAANLSQQWS